MTRPRAAIVEAVATPVCPPHGPLASWHPVDLLASVLAAAVERAGVEPTSVDDVLVGCDTPVGAQAPGLGAAAVDAAGWPETTPVAATDRPLVHAVEAVASGAASVVVAAGVAGVSTVPPGAATVRDYGRPRARHASPGGVAEDVAARYGLDREALDEVARRSTERAAAAAGRAAAGRGVLDVVPVPPVVVSDAAELAALPPQFADGGLVTAATVAQPADGAAAAVVAGPDVVAELGRSPLGWVRATAVAGGPPDHQPLVRCARAAGLEGVGRVEVEETAAPFLLAWLAETAVDPDIVNPDGGALAWGHPGAAEPVRMLAALARALPRDGLGLLVARSGALLIEPDRPYD